MLSVLEEMPPAEMGSVLGVSPAAAEVLAVRARTALVASVASRAGRAVPWAVVASAYRARLGRVAAPLGAAEALALARG